MIKAINSYHCNVFNNRFNVIIIDGFFKIEKKRFQKVSLAHCPNFRATAINNIFVCFKGGVEMGILCA
jgi:hypothetical protein